MTDALGLEDKRIYYKSIYFDLPFLIFVKDGFKDKQLEEWAKAFSEGKKELPFSPYAPSSNKQGFMSIGGGFPVYLPPETMSEAYVVKLKEMYLGVQFLRRINQTNPANLCGEIIGDRTGRASFSSVRINFDLRQFEKNTHWNTRLFVNLAIDGVNKFIENYRIMAERFYIRPITPQIIQNFCIFNDYTDGTSLFQNYTTDKSTISIPCEVNPLEEHLVYFMDATLHGMGGSISEENDQALRQILTQDLQPSIVETLKLEVKDKLDLREWRLAVIESAVLFETFINIHLRHVYKCNGLNDTDIENKFVKNDRNSTPLSSFGIAKTLVIDATGYDFENTVEFSDWATNTKDLRNEIVHGKRFYVSKEEAELSFDSVLNAINAINVNTIH